MRHNFLRSDGAINEPSKIDRLRVMYVVGLLTDMEYTLRATAGASERQPFAFQHAGHAFQLRQRLQSVHQSLQSDALVIPGLDDAVGAATKAKTEAWQRPGVARGSQRHEPRDLAAIMECGWRENVGS